MAALDDNIQKQLSGKTLQVWQRHDLLDPGGTINLTPPAD
jgi:hypothetical protein